MTVERGPIETWRVLDLGIITAGAATSALLADFGADVIKIESQSYSDPFRKWGGKWGLGSTVSPVFQFTNRNKRGLELDLKTPEGKARFLALVARSDIVIENFRCGVLDRLGIGYEEMAKVNPRIVLASLSSQGTSGPDKQYASYGSTLEATGGLSILTGYEGDAPVISGRNVNYPDQIVALLAVGAIIAGVMTAKRTGNGAHLDVSQREVTAFSVGEYIAAATRKPVESKLLRRGNADPGGRVQGVFRSADDCWIAVTVEDSALPAVDHIVTLPAEAANRGNTESGLRRWIGNMTAEEAIKTLTIPGVSAAKALKGSQILEAASPAFHRVFREDANGNLVKGSPFQAEESFTVERAAPTLGEHTNEILKEVLGINP